MARSSGYNLGSIPPQITWTVVRGDTASFRVYVTDDNKVALHLPDWSLDMKVKRPVTAQKVVQITDAATTILTLSPEQTEFDSVGEFTVSLTSEESFLLRTGDFFDIQVSDPTRVWTVAQGSMVIIEDVTD